MQNRFGLKDFVFLVVLLATLGSVWLSMVQKTRMELAQADAQSKLDAIEQQLAQLSRKVEQGVAVAPQAGGAPAAADDSWARPGVKVERWPVPSMVSDPTKVPGFREGGTFTELFDSQSQKFTPYIAGDVLYTFVLARVCESLGTFNPTTLQLEGSLADAWQVDPAGLWIRAHIHPRACFSDGKPVTAEDVRWTYRDFIANPLIEAERSRSILDNLKDVKVIDDRTVEFVFGEPLYSNLNTAFLNPILPKHYYSRFEPSQLNQSTGLLMGSGQYRMARLPSGPDDLDSQWTTGQDIELERNEQYWGEKPPIERLRYRVVKDEMARLVAYRNGEGSMMTPSAPQFNRVAREDPDFGNTTHMLRWTNMRGLNSFIAWQCGPRNGKLTPFHDKRVRRAMTHLLDRERMIRDIWDGIGVVSKGPLNPESPASDPAVKPLPFDPAKGMALLKEAGWEDRNGDGVLEDAKGDPFEFEFTYATGGEISERIARFVKDSYTKAGIAVTTRPLDWSRYQEILKLRDFDAITLGWGSSAPESDPRQIWHSESIKEGGDNFVQWRNAECDALIEKGRRTMDTPARMTVWRQFEAVVAEDQPYTFVRVAPWLRFVKREFGNVHTYRSGLQPEEFCLVAQPASGN
jgi:peptide/nickel transport system substrate-binding protein